MSISSSPAGSRVMLISVAGPRGHVDVGVRADATPAQLAAALGAVIGLSGAEPAAQHRSPPRPGAPDGRRAVLPARASLAESGVTDGDLITLAPAGDGRPATAGGTAP